MNGNIQIYQIYYDELTKRKLDPGFIPLNNAESKKNDWYEFLPIFNTLNQLDMDDDSWYGFLSPRFTEKTGYDSSYINNVLTHHAHHCEVLLFSYAWDQLSFFLNPFEQGEYWHPGIMPISQQFFNLIGVDIDLAKFVSCCKTSAFSNYIIAKPKYWKSWLSLASKFYSVVEKGDIPELSINTCYVSPERQVPIKVFIQERLSSIILSNDSFKTLSIDQSIHGDIFTMIFNDDISTRRRLQTCDLLKELYMQSGNVDYMKVFYEIRKGIYIKNK